MVAGGHPDRLQSGLGYQGPGLDLVQVESQDAPDVVVVGVLDLLHQDPSQLTERLLFGPS